MTIILCILGFIAIICITPFLVLGCKAINTFLYCQAADRRIAEYRKHTAEIERATERIYHCIALDYDMEFRKKHQAVINNYHIDKAVILKGENDDAKTIVQPIDYSYECQ